MKPSKEVLDEEEEAFLPGRDQGHGQAPIAEERQNRWRASHIVRVLIEVAMATAIVVLLVRQGTARSTIRRTPVPQRTITHYRIEIRH